MKKQEYTISTQIIGTEDGKLTYEVRKTISIEEGKRAVLIALYPTVSLLSPYTMDNSTLFLLNRAQELGYNDFRIVNIYSKVCKGKVSSKQLFRDDDNIAYLEKVFVEEQNNNTDILIAWGTSFKLNETSKNIKIEVLQMLKKIIKEKNIKQLTADDLDTESLLTPHVLWLGLHCKDTWYTKSVSIDQLLLSLGVNIQKRGRKKKKGDETIINKIISNEDAS